MFEQSGAVEHHGRTLMWLTKFLIHVGALSKDIRRMVTPVPYLANRTPGSFLAGVTTYYMLGGKEMDCSLPRTIEGVSLCS